MWFHKKDLTFHRSITDKYIRGYVLPHASTTYTGKIISHTLRFKPSFTFNKVCIIYYPSSPKPNVHNYYHEYYVPMKCMQHFVKKWNMKKITYVGINLRDEQSKQIDVSNTLLIVSADFSHFLPLQKAIELENKAAHSLMFQQHRLTPYTKIVDDIKSFKFLHRIIPNEWILQWVGRTRSPGEEGVGYLSFLLKEPVDIVTNPPVGMITTYYDNKMNVSNKSNKDISYYTITYLYEDNKNFIRGYHCMVANKSILPTDFLEHTFTNGQWIRSTDIEWKDGNFRLKETLHSLSNKYKLYKTEVLHYKI